MLSIRKRGKNYHVRGIVAYGDRKITVNERSTGIAKFSEAKKYAKDLEDNLLNQLKGGHSKSQSDITFSQCVAVYSKGKKLSNGTINKVMAMLERFGNVYISDLKMEWLNYIVEKKHLKKNSIARDLTTIKAVINYASDVLDFTPPKIKKETEFDEKYMLLDDDVRPKLLECYSSHTKIIFKTLAYAGLRTQECLQLNFENVSLDRKIISIKKSKMGKSREVPMHDIVYDIIKNIWIERGMPKTGKIFLNKNGKAYVDTRITGYGGNPLTKAHKYAVQRLKDEYGINLRDEKGKLTFTPHGWRHDWGARLLMAGVDSLTVQRIAGWSSKDMLKRYAGLSKQFELSEINKI